MPVTDPVADMLTRIRNALVVKKEVVDMPASKMKMSIAKILLKEGFIKGCELIEDGVQGTLRVKLKYGANGERVISGLKKISRPGLRIAIISTSKGVITDAEARKNSVGGEVLAYIW